MTNDQPTSDHTGTSVTHAAIAALSVLVDQAREMAVDAPTAELINAASSLSRTLDAARTRLVQEGDDYLDAAWAFVDAGRKLIVTTGVNVLRARQQSAILAAVREAR